MPRLSPNHLLHAHRLHAHLPALLRACRDLPSAQNELRWLREHAGADSERLRALVRRRAKGVPLQYVLGSEFFGDLEIVCKPGVLIPRQDTAAAITHLASLLLQYSKRLPPNLRVLDLCTGTGCIPLLAEHLLHPAVPDPHFLGVDVSLRCLQLAQLNASRCRAQRTRFLRADVLASNDASNAGPIEPLLPLLHRAGTPTWDVLISNPPYISPRHFVRTTARSVRNWEPKLALVPRSATGSAGEDADTAVANDDAVADTFYPALLRAADGVGAKVALFEVADLEQGMRVAGMVKRGGGWDGVEVWRDEPGVGNMQGSGHEQGVWRVEGGGTEGEEAKEVEEEAEGARVRGRGEGRSVVCWRGEGGRWLGQG
ncbi:uncharacterized protein K452DRAFT_302090 [Aplosporella prunicola CBS 121167]|uniref:Release factor glutamine methyltransferase N-terminal domain-containing protein n=1 Tax=Aplosporella prunicola CBS 121167 TaxID=1176127 RepID=A0A6A6B245_9PEZI|nr:uncharacterized protein K452DRAFT_302090 [Aplosporella prunicola CBS 121167]KAF2137335.1 hypothetical protein K452DRAFT_302090 [Aplosporella prunicola CBS 121167]